MNALYFFQWAFNSVFFCRCNSNLSTCHRIFKYLYNNMIKFDCRIARRRLDSSQLTLDTYAKQMKKRPGKGCVLAGVTSLASAPMDLYGVAEYHIIQTVNQNPQCRDAPWCIRHAYPCIPPGKKLSIIGCSEAFSLSTSAAWARSAWSSGVSPSRQNPTFDSRRILR